VTSELNTIELGANLRINAARAGWVAVNHGRTMPTVICRSPPAASVPPSAIRRARYIGGRRNSADHADGQGQPACLIWIACSASKYCAAADEALHGNARRDYQAFTGEVLFYPTLESRTPWPRRPAPVKLRYGGQHGESEHQLPTSSPPGNRRLSATRS